MKNRNLLVGKAGAAVLAAAIVLGSTSGTALASIPAMTGSSIIHTAASLSSLEKKYKKALAAQQQAQSDCDNSKQALQTAMTTYENKGFEFIDANASAGYKFSDIKAAMESDSSVSQYASGLENGMKDALSTDNLKKSVSLMNELNSLRARTDNWSGSADPVSVNYNLMLYAAASGYVYEFTSDHTLFKSDVPSSSSAECLAWGASDPFYLWYTAEKAIYDEDPSTNAAGHYIIMTTPDYKSVGLTYNSNATAAMDFSYHDTGVSVNDFSTALNSYTQPAKDAYSAALADYQTKKKQLSAANKKVSSAKKALVKKAKPSKPKIKVKRKKKSITVTYKKSSRAVKYQIKFKKKGGKWKTITTKKRKYTIKKLKKGKKYYVKVRALGKYGTKSSYSKTVSVKIR